MKSHFGKISHHIILCANYAEMLAGVATSKQHCLKDAGFARDLLEELLGHQIATAVERALSAHRQLRSATCNHAGLGLFLLWEAYWPSGYPLGIKALAMMSRHRAFELYDRLKLAFRWESRICIWLLRISSS